MRLKTRHIDSTLALLLAAKCAAQTSFPRAVAGDGFVSIPVAAVAKSGYSIGAQEKRAGNSIDVTLENMQVFYAVEVGLGTPPQSVTVLVDTGSSELWVNPDCSTARSQVQAEQCETFGQYDPARSKTPPVGPFGGEQINYGDPSDQSTITSVKIRFYSDNVSFGHAVVKNQTFGVVAASRGQSQGILGLAPDTRTGFDSSTPYSLLLNTMAEQGVIASRVFSLDLRHSDSADGSVVFGGLDRSKFTGSLAKQPFVKGLKGEYRLAVNVDTLGFTADKSRSFKLADADTGFMLDSGTTLTRMHAAAALPILQALGAEDSGQGYYYVPCRLRKAVGSIDFGFGGKTVRVPLSDFILGDETARDTQFCPVGLVVTTDQQILGDSVLRAGYFVFDWDNEEVHIAQAANCGDDDLVAVGTGKNAVPDVQGNCKDDGSRSSASLTARPTITRNQLPTAAYTTVHTITSCPSFDLSCVTGLVTTETVRPAQQTAASSIGGGNGGGDQNAGARPETFIYLFTLLGIFGVLWTMA